MITGVHIFHSHNFSHNLLFIFTVNHKYFSSLVHQREFLATIQLYCDFVPYSDKHSLTRSKCFWNFGGTSLEIANWSKRTYQSRREHFLPIRVNQCGRLWLLFRQLVSEYNIYPNSGKSSSNICSMKVLKGKIWQLAGKLN